MRNLSEKPKIFKWCLLLIFVFLPVVFLSKNLVYKKLNIAEKEVYIFHRQSENAAKRNFDLTSGKTAEVIKGLSIPFVENIGQKDMNVKFYADLIIGTLFVMRDGEIVYALKGRGGRIDVIREKFNWNNVRVESGEKSTTSISYFVGKKRFSNIPAYRYVTIKAADGKTGLKLIAYGGKVEKMFEIEPGVNPSEIVVEVKGAEHMSLINGELYLTTKFGTYRFSRPIFFQNAGNKRLTYRGQYRIIDETHYGFEIKSYDRSRPLYIDPVMYGTYIGGGSRDNNCGGFGNDEVKAVYVNSDGAVFIAGFTCGDFPVTSGSYDTTCNKNGDIFIAKFSHDLNKLLSATYLGGKGNEHVTGIQFSNGALYVAGYTYSADFPIAGGYQYSIGSTTATDGFIARFSEDLSTLEASTYLGGSDDDGITSLFITSDGTVFVGGYTASVDFPGVNGFQKSVKGHMEGFVSKLNENFSEILSSTYLGGSDFDWVTSVFAGGTGYVYVAGWTDSYDFPVTDEAYQKDKSWSTEGFVSKFDATLSNLIASTYIGGEEDDEIKALYVTPVGKVFIAGWTWSDDFPVVGGFQNTRKGSADGFVSRFSGNLHTLEASTYLGGTDDDEISTVKVSEDGNIYVAGRTESYDFPVTSEAFQKINKTSEDYIYEGFISRLNWDLSDLLSSTYFGGKNDDEVEAIFITSNREIYVAGWTDSYDFPVTQEAFQDRLKGMSDGFIGRFDYKLWKLLASTYIGGGGFEFITSIYVSKNGDVYAGGDTFSYDFPTTSQAYRKELSGTMDGFVVRLSNDLSNLKAATYIGGSEEDGVNNVFESNGKVYIAGGTDSDDFPVVNGFQNHRGGDEDGFIVLMSDDLSRLEASTYIGGSDEDDVNSLWVTDDGKVFIAGFTYSDDYPTTNAFQSKINGGTDGFISRLDSSLGNLIASTYLGGSEDDEIYSIYVTGSVIYVGGGTFSDDFPVKGAFQGNKKCCEDGFISKLDTGLQDLIASTFIGGDDLDEVDSIYVTSGGDVYAGGWTWSDDFPLRGSPYQDSIKEDGDIFVIRMSGDLVNLLASTYFGGNQDDYVNSVIVKNDGVYVAGYTGSEDFPISGSYQRKFGGGWLDGFVSKMDPDLSHLIASTYFGGSGLDVIISSYSSGEGIYIAGFTTSPDLNMYGYDVTFGGCSDGFIAFLSSDYFVNHPPVLNSVAAEPSSGNAPLNVVISVDASDPDGDPLKYYYDCNGDNNYEETDSDNNTYQCTYSNPGTYYAQVRVSDGKATTQSEKIKIEVYSSGESGEGNEGGETGGNEGEGSSGGSKGTSGKGLSSGGEKSSGCGCRVDGSGNNWGDFMVMLLLLPVWIGVRRRGRV